LNLFEDDENQSINQSQKSNGDYSYGSDIVWKYQMLRMVLEAYNEPMLNLHFLGPYLKNSSCSLNSYEVIFQLLWVIDDQLRS